MRVFNLAEELEKERKRSKILEENNKLLIQQKAKMYEDLDKLSNRIDKAIEYFNELEKENNKIIKFEVQHDEYQHIMAETENALIDNIKNILKGDNNE